MARMHCSLLVAVWAVLLLLVVKTGGVAAQEDMGDGGEGRNGTGLSCDHECECRDVQRSMFSIDKEYIVTCNVTSNQTVTLTEDVFPEESVYKTFVTVTKAAVLHVTPGFLDRWHQYHSCILDVQDVDQLFLPDLPRYVPGTRPRLISTSQVFAGMRMANVNVGHFPAGLFSGKLNAGIIFDQSSVGRVSPGLMRDVEEVGFLKIKNSNIGKFWGPLSDSHLTIKKQKQSRPLVHLYNSTIGVFGSGALIVNVPAHENLVMEDMTFGLVENNAVNISGKGRLVLNNSRVADLQENAFVVHGESSIIATNNFLAIRPSAFLDLPCDYHHNNIRSNNIVTLPFKQKTQKIDSEPVSTSPDPTPTQATEDESQDISIRDRLAGILREVLHPTCVEDNLPPWLIEPSHPTEPHTLTSKPSILPLLLSPTTPAPKFSEKLLRLGLYTFLGLCGMALLVIVILTCLLVRSRQRRKPAEGNQVPVMLMSSIQDPIYDEPRSLNLIPPPVPAPTALLTMTRTSHAKTYHDMNMEERDDCSTDADDCCSKDKGISCSDNDNCGNNNKGTSCSDNDGYCGSNTYTPKAVENNYMQML